MGEILGIQGGIESVWKLVSFQNWWHKMVPLVYFWRIYFSHSNTMPFNSRLAVIEINRCQWCHHIAILRYVGLGKGGNNSLVSWPKWENWSKRLRTAGVDCRHSIDRWYRGYAPAALVYPPPPTSQTSGSLPDPPQRNGPVLAVDLPVDRPPSPHTWPPGYGR